MFSIPATRFLLLCNTTFLICNDAFLAPTLGYAKSGAKSYLRCNKMSLADSGV